MFMSSLMPFEFQFQQSHSQHKFFLDILLLPQPAWIKFIPSDTNWLHIFTCTLPLLRLLCVHKIPYKKVEICSTHLGPLLLSSCSQQLLGWTNEIGLRRLNSKDAFPTHSGMNYLHFPRTWAHKRPLFRSKRVEGGRNGGRFGWVKCWPEGVHNDFLIKFFAQWTIKLPTCNQIHFSCSLTLLFGKVHRGMHFDIFLNTYSCASNGQQPKKL